jgi:hypothetical protein
VAAVIEVFEKIRERLEENSYNEPIDDMNPFPPCRVVELKDAIEIVNQAKDVVLEKEFSEWCTDCKEYDKERHHCPRFCKVIRESVEECKEAYADRWIPCSERLPSEEEAWWYDKERELYVPNKFLVTIEGEKSTEILYFDVANVPKKWSDLSGNISNVIAWQPLPEPYRPKGEHQ